MPCRLRSYDQSPPGQFPYVQHQGIYKQFPATPIIEAQAQNVASFRQANGLPRASIKESLEDVDAFTCQRLGCMSAYCVNTDTKAVALNASSPVIDTGCKGCGARVVA